MKMFTEPTVEIEKFMIQDVITASGDGDEWTPGDNETGRV